MPIRTSFAGEPRRAVGPGRPVKRGSLLREALTALIERESAKRLARLGGTQADLEAAPRRRPERPE